MDVENKEISNDSTKTIVESMNEKITKIAANMERVQIADYVHLLNRPRKLIWTNLLAGIFRGIGIALGFTVFAATIVYVLQFIGALNLPIVGGYIAEIVKHVQFQLQREGYY